MKFVSFFQTYERKFETIDKLNLELEKQAGIMSFISRSELWY